MKTEHLTPEQSLELITQVINQARNRFEENGFIYVFWGTLIALASFGQFWLLRTGHFDINWYPYLLMPLGAIYSSVYYARKKRSKTQNLIGKILSILWVALATNMLILGFFFAGTLKENLIPVILILLSVGILSSGATLRSKILLYAGFFVGLSAFVAFYLSRLYQPLLMGMVSVVAILVPGLILMMRHEGKENL